MLYADKKKSALRASATMTRQSSTTPDQPSQSSAKLKLYCYLPLSCLRALLQGMFTSVNDNLVPFTVRAIITVFFLDGYFRCIASYQAGNSCLSKCTALVR